jgi:hypothetical protein
LGDHKGRPPSGDCGCYVKKALEMGTMHFERQFKYGYGNEASLSLSLWELCEQNLGTMKDM